MTKRDILIHSALASSMSTFEIRSMIKELQSEKSELEPFLSPKEIEKYTVLISVYTKELDYILNLTTQKDSFLVH